MTKWSPILRDVEDKVFKALADPTRRHLLDLLFAADGQTLSALEAEVDMTRFGVAKHLAVLEDAGLVTTRRTGREKRHHLNPVPIRELHDRWLDKFSANRASALLALRATLEGDPVHTTAAPTADQVYRILIRATPQAVWDAITRPEFTVQYFHGARVETTGEPGTPFRYHSADGQSLWGDETVLESDPPHRLVVGWRSLYDPELATEPTSRVTWEIEDQGDGVVLVTVVHDRLGDSPRTAASVSGVGWMGVLSGLKSLLETGRGLR